MEETFVRCRNVWWHFFIKPLYGLCFRKKEQGRFSNFEVLLPDACEDFYALSFQDSIHLICQDRSGNIIYLSYEEDTWRKAVLLESKSPSPYPKYFSLIPMGNFLNLFYVIAYKEKYMLIHQILTGDNRPPAVVDHIRMQSPPYLTTHTGTDITVLYENEAGTSGSRLYRWSRKEFGQFMPLHPEHPCQVRGVLAEAGERVRYAAFKTFDKLSNLVYFEKTAEGIFTEPVTLYLDCPADAAPVFCRDGKKLFLVWQEKGSVMSAHSADDGVKWSKPVRYMKGSATAPALYTICENGTIRKSYGYEKDGKPVFYVGPDLSETEEEQKSLTFQPEGFEAEEFAKSMGAPVSEPPASKDPMIDLLKTDLTHTKDQLFSLRKEVAFLSERLEKLEAILWSENSFPIEKTSNGTAEP